MSIAKHIPVAVPDVEAAQAEVLALGAAPLDLDDDDRRDFRVYADPPGIRSASAADSRADGKENLMTGRRPEDAEESGTPIPKDLPDQQAQEDKDLLDAPRPGAPDERTDEPDESLPDLDETGAGRSGAPRGGGVHPERPVPDEAPG
jgi:hypothetical protein